MLGRSLAAVAAGVLAWNAGPDFARAEDLVPLKGGVGASTTTLKFDGQATTELVARGGGGFRGGVAVGGFRGGVSRGGFRGGFAVGGFRGGVVRAGSWGAWGRSPWIGWGRGIWVGWGRSPWFGWGRSPWFGWGWGSWPIYRPVFIVPSPFWGFPGNIGWAGYGESSFGVPYYDDCYGGYATASPAGLRAVVPAPLPDGAATYPYNGGPSAPVPMPGEPAPASAPKRATVPLQGRFVSLPAQPTQPATRFAYPAYGEEPRSTSFATDRVVTVKAR
jgi:hypothetical protein